MNDGSSSDGPTPADTAPAATEMVAAVSTPFGGQSSAYSPALDAMAVFMLGLVMVITGGVAALAVRLHRRARHPEPATLLLEEVEAESGVPSSNPHVASPADHGSDRAMAEGSEPAAPWERNDDWWKATDRSREPTGGG